MAGTGVLYLWNLGVNGWANPFYSAAIQAASKSWEAFLFGSFDASNSITVDKPPASLWIPALAVRVFGLNSYSILVPQVLMGLAAFFLLYATVARVAGRPAGLLAGSVLALTPVATLMFRYNNPDALVVLLMTAAAYALCRALQNGKQAVWWMLAAGALLGLGFLTKQLQVLLVVPGFGLAYLLAAPIGWVRRIGHLLAAAAGLVLAAGWWVLLVELWPASARPYIGGSQHNSVLELTFGYNGLGRLSGTEDGSVGTRRTLTAGLFRLFGGGFAIQASWLLPAALILLGGTAWVLYRTRAWRIPAGRQFTGMVIAFGTWLLLTGLVFTFMRGIIHTYYTVALVPAIGALIGLGSWLLWRHRKHTGAITMLGAAVAATGFWAWYLTGRGFLQGWGGYVAMAALAGAIGLALCARRPANSRVSLILLPVAAVLAIASALAAPAAYSAATTQVAKTGAIIIAGPRPTIAHHSGFGHHPAGAPTIPGGLVQAPVPSAAAVRLLREGGDSYRWVAAAIGANNAAGYQLATGLPVMPAGGFNGTDPFPTLAQFKTMVSRGDIHYWIGGGLPEKSHGGSRTSKEINDWVSATFIPTEANGTVLYDLTATGPAR
ncbi:ArnT family glycosyltransferase [Paeniglutamicibacter cryotolerans]|uniref:4-amino-4-deoxy-L-arabinose transferase-like glycosyltransferase n=1 Tax=Paeniglutamicibacter cryotolerans TaxID=670079 RepID=A0A839QMS8_9MICC|nr:glycosyltransferase family 39 protein [Paeniglutamicibacter cryotolerans]MBB2995306.1 4-amino-4-deoxy-L-arabinose transferase-like glycosyltransferase [Paeniglutamicibacter cryotolerans]